MRLRTRSRSKYRKKFIDINLINTLKLYYSNFKNKATMQINTYSRSSTIFPCFEKMTINIHNGKKFLPLTIQEHHLGSKFGEFVFTRKFLGHKKEGRKVVYKKKKYTPKPIFKNVLINKKKLYNKVKFIKLLKFKSKKVLKSAIINSKSKIKSKKLDISKPMPLYTKYAPIPNKPITKALAFILNSTMPISKSLAKALSLVPISKSMPIPVKPVVPTVVSKVIPVIPKVIPKVVPTVKPTVKPVVSKVVPKVVPKVKPVVSTVVSKVIPVIPKVVPTSTSNLKSKSNIKPKR